VAQLDGETRRLRLLVDHREDMVVERTRMQSRLRWHVHEIFPGLEIAPKSLGRLHVIAALDRRLGPVEGTVAAIARELLGRIRDLTVRINELQREITQLVRPLAPSLLAMPGCGPLSAAKILGEVAGAARFRSRAAFARWNGTAPIPVWSGNDTRHRLNRGGNRQVTRRCTASRSPSGAGWEPVEPTSSTVLVLAAPRPRPCVSFVAGSPTRCSVASLSTKHSWGARRCGRV